MPTLSFQPGVSASGQLARGASPATCPSRSGPRHCGQSGRRGPGVAASDARGDETGAGTRRTLIGPPDGIPGSYSERSDSSTGRREHGGRGQARDHEAGRGHGGEQQQHRGERRQRGALGEAGQGRDERRAGADPEAQQQQQRGLREHHGPHVARAVADRAQERELAALLEGVAHEDRPDARACRAAGPGPRASGTWRCRCSRRGGRPRGATPRSRRVEAEVREARLERSRATAALAAGRGLDQEEAIAVGLGERALEVALARHQLALEAAPARSAATTRTRTPVSPSVHVSPSRGGARTRGRSASAITGNRPVRVRRARAAATGWPCSSGGRGQAALEREAALAQEAGARARSASGRSGR